MQGSATSYGSITITNKSLKIIGAGYAPNKLNVQPSSLGTAQFNNNIPRSLDGSEVHGLYINGYPNFINNALGSVINDIEIINNKVSGIQIVGFNFILN